MEKKDNFCTEGIPLTNLLLIARIWKQCSSCCMEICQHSSSWQYLRRKLLMTCSFTRRSKISSKAFSKMPILWLLCAELWGRYPLFLILTTISRQRPIGRPQRLSLSLSSQHLPQFLLELLKGFQQFNLIRIRVTPKTFCTCCLLILWIQTLRFLK
jgi:hypothetical protein